MNFFKDMLDKIIALKLSTKFLLIVFFLCYFPIATSAFSDFTGPNLITLRTLFASILGYFLEDVTSNECKCKSSGPIEHYHEGSQNKSSSNLEVRVLIIGTLLLLITISLIIISAKNIDHTNDSLMLLRNTAFASVGFLISASKNK